MKRTLTLKSESLSELSAAELGSVVGGHALPTTPAKECLADLFDTLQATRCFCP